MMKSVLVDRMPPQLLMRSIAVAATHSKLAEISYCNPQFIEAEASDRLCLASLIAEMIFPRPWDGVAAIYCLCLLTHIKCRTEDHVRKSKEAHSSPAMISVCRSSVMSLYFSPPQPVTPRQTDCCRDSS